MGNIAFYWDYVCFSKTCLPLEDFFFDFIAYSFILDLQHFPDSADGGEDVVDAEQTEHHFRLHADPRECVVENNEYKINFFTQALIEFVIFSWEYFTVAC